MASAAVVKLMSQCFNRSYTPTAKLAGGNKGQDPITPMQKSVSYQQ